MPGLDSSHARIPAGQNAFDLVRYVVELRRPGITPVGIQVGYEEGNGLIIANARATGEFRRQADRLANDVNRLCIAYSFGSTAMNGHGMVDTNKRPVGSISDQLSTDDG